jgi:hypothetical protein
MVPPSVEALMDMLTVNRPYTHNTLVYRHMHAYLYHGDAIQRCLCSSSLALHYTACALYVASLSVAELKSRV